MGRTDSSHAARVRVSPGGSARYHRAVRPAEWGFRHATRQGPRPRRRDRDDPDRRPQRDHGRRRRAGRARHGGPRPEPRRPRRRPDGRHRDLSPRGAALERARLRGHAHPQRVRRDDRDQPDQRVGAVALADRDDELAGDRARLRRDDPLADRAPRDDDARGWRHARRHRVRRLAPERRDDVPARRVRRLRGPRRREAMATWPRAASVQAPGCSAWTSRAASERRPG